MPFDSGMLYLHDFLLLWTLFLLFFFYELLITIDEDVIHLLIMMIGLCLLTDYEELLLSCKDVS